MSLLIVGMLAVSFVAGCTQTGQVISADQGELVCMGIAGSCSQERVTYVRDGANLETTERMVRLAMIDAPARTDTGYFDDATNFVFSSCSGKLAFVDIDDAQPTDSEGRNVALVYCDGKNVNKELLELGYAKTLASDCGTSEFASEPWANAHGC